jgi:hypothetical protein
MKDSNLTTSDVPALRAGDWVEVRSADEILATLDERGCLDSLPFMPEMLEYCGRSFRIFKSAHKTCDTIEHYKGRRMTSAVHLEGLRCDGAAHGGCQAGCLLFWKEAWLQRVRGPGLRASTPSHAKPAVESASGSCCDIETLTRATRAPAGDGKNPADRYACQATELLRATTPLHWWEPGSYLKDLTSRNVRLGTLVFHMTIAAFNVVMRLHWRGRPNAYPYIRGLAGEKTPTEVLNLKEGDLVRVRTKEEIRRTLDANCRNRGLSFDVEMVRYCGQTFRVLRRVEKIIDEKSGKMIYPPGVCLILEGVTCIGCLSKDRLFCPRSISPYWREIWLRRVD